MFIIMASSNKHVISNATFTNFRIEDRSLINLMPTLDLDCSLINLMPTLDC